MNSAKPHDQAAFAALIGADMAALLANQPMLLHTLQHLAFGRALQGRRIMQGDQQGA